jgi:hypothetical protein
VCNNPGFEIVADSSPGNPAKKLIHMNMTAEPGTLLAVKTWLYIRILAVGQRTYKQKNLENFTGGSVYQLHDFSAPVNLAGIPRTMSKMIRQVVAGSVCLIAHAKLRITEGKLAVRTACSLILLPQKLESNTYSFKLLVNMSIVWLAVDGLVNMLVWIKLAICFLVCERGYITKRNPLFLGNAQHIADGTL